MYCCEVAVCNFDSNDRADDGVCQELLVAWAHDDGAVLHLVFVGEVDFHVVPLLADNGNSVEGDIERSVAQFER